MSRIAVVGAGIAGLCAARALVDAGHDVVVHEAADRVGGRLATVEVAGATADIGAQFFTVRGDRLDALVEAHPLVYEWCRGFGPEPDGYPRYAARGGMAAFAAVLGDGLDVHVSSPVADLADIEPWDAAVVAAPPSVAAALGLADVPQLEWTPTTAVVVVLDGPAAVPEPGAIGDPDPPFTFVADNQRKGTSSVPCLTLHARGADATNLVDEAGRRGWLGGAAVVATHVVEWAHAGCDPIAERCVVLDAPDGSGRPVVLAGDWCGGPKVEGAANSGWAAADHLTSFFGT